MKQRLIVILPVVVLVALMVAVSLLGSGIQASPLNAQPTTIPTTIPYDITTAGSNSVDISHGGVFRSGIAIEGNANEQQLLIQPYATQTADIFVVNSGAGVELFAIEGDGPAAFKIPTTIAVTDDSTITATGTVIQLSAAASCGTSSIAAGSSGQLLYLIGPASNTVTITNTGTLKLSGNIALSAEDTLSLVSDGTNWYQLGTSNN